MEELLLKYYNKELNSHESDKVQNWLDEDEKNLQAYKDMVRIWECAPKAEVFEHIPVTEDWQNVRKRIATGKGKSLNFFLKVAAGIALLFSVGLVGYLALDRNSQQVFEVRNSDHTGENSIVLPDGTVVRVNAQTRLLYPKKFKGDRRIVELEGEAYFEVKRNPNKPFIIRHGDSETRVLGTKFNLRAYPDENTVQVAVTEGKVQLSEVQDPSKHVILTRNKVGEYNRTTKKMVKLDQVDENFLSWRTGVLTFRNASLVKVARDLKRHYRIEFVIQDKKTAVKTKVSARFENQKLDDVLNELSLVLGMEFTRKKNFILIDN